MVDIDMNKPLSAWQIAEQFAKNTKLISVEVYSGGIINQTYLVNTDNQRFILQRINPHVFPYPEQILANLETLLNHVQQVSNDPQSKSNSEKQLKFPELLTQLDQSHSVINTDGSTWRALSFIENTRTLPTITTDLEAQQVGWALGQFHRQVHNLDPTSLYDTLPGFHSAPDYLKHYHQILASNAHINNPELTYCQQFIEQRQHQFTRLEHAKHQKLLRTRIIHGDPKLANILFEQTSAQAVALIDLDTVKPGLIHYDIGDCLRSCCNSAKRPESNTQKAKFELDICALILTDYLQQAQEFLTLYDYHYLYDAIHLIPLELGSRYVTDYLDGNRYFSVDRPEQNLHRAIQQFELTDSIEQQQTAIKQLIKHNMPRS